MRANLEIPIEITDSIEWLQGFTRLSLPLLEGWLPNGEPEITKPDHTIHNLNEHDELSEVEWVIEQEFQVLSGAARPMDFVTSVTEMLEEHDVRVVVQGMDVEVSCDLLKPAGFVGCVPLVAEIWSRATVRFVHFDVRLTGRRTR